jgi:hypothetical protein
MKSLMNHPNRDKQKDQCIACILVGYSLRDTIYSLGAINLLAEILGFEHKILVWNKGELPEDIDKLSRNDWQVHLGSNVNHEFSGWQEGLAILPNRPSKYDYVVFVNDSLSRFSSDTRKSHLLSSLAKSIKSRSKPAAVGLIHYPCDKSEYLELQSTQISSWLCTGCFALPGEYIKKINGKIDHSSATELLISRSGKSLVNDTCPISTKLHIHKWLTDNENGWHAALPQPHSEQDLAILRDKAKMILNEFTLSAKLAQSGCLLHDPTDSKKWSKNKLHTLLLDLNSYFRKVCLSRVNP